MTKRFLFYFILLILILLFLQSCEKKEKIEYLESISHVTEVNHNDTTLNNSELLIHVFSFGTSGCSRISKHESIRNDTIYEYTFFQKNPKNAFCTFDIIVLESQIVVSFDQPGQKILRFKQWEGYLTDTIFVKEE